MLFVPEDIHLCVCHAPPNACKHTHTRVYVCEIFMENLEKAAAGQAGELVDPSVFI